MNWCKSNPKVLIVGAGPVGMLLALELALFGIKAKIISRHVRISSHSKASIIWPRILELLDRTGLSEKIVREAHYFDQMNYYSNKSLIGSIRFHNLQGTHYPFGVTIPQWRTEKILESSMLELGLDIDYGSYFVAGRQEEKYVMTTICSSLGVESVCNFDWVVGADGFQSDVRTNFGFDFTGYSMRTRLAIADAEILGESTSGEIAYFLHKTGNMVLAPLGDGIFRVGASVPDGYVEHGKPDREFFNALLATRVPGKKKIGEMRFSGVFTAHVRTTSTFRKGRVFLVGDAAHAMSPSGAQGLNTGFQDAVNLAWKLAGVINESLLDKVLDTYSDERLNAVKRVSSLSTQLARLSLYKSVPKILARDTLFRIASKTKIMERYFSSRITQLDTSTVHRKANRKALREGGRVPLSWLDSWNVPVLSKISHTLLLWPGRQYTYATWVEFGKEIQIHFPNQQVVSLDGRSPGHLLPYLPNNALCIVVRPDGHIASLLPIAHERYHEVIDSIRRGLTTFGASLNRGFSPIAVEADPMT